MIKVKLFANLRELAGASEFDLEASSIANVRELIDELIKQTSSELGAELADETAMVSINKKYAGWEASVKDGDEVGILPPVSGG